MTLSGAGKHLMRRLLFILSLVGALNCAHSAPAGAIARLSAWLVGSYSNSGQTKADSGYRYVILKVARIWPERTDGPWLYAEQALANAPEQPYRQLVYRLTQRPDDLIEVRAYDLRDPVGLTNAWREPIRFSKLSPAADLLPREGCTLYLREKSPGVFTGSTDGKNCPGELPGATYSTSEMTVTETTVILWDRGFNIRDIQVWGPIAGGYVFEKLPERG
jgi:CpeT protein